ncbi:MAG: XdhC family protein [Verrucomicrobiota bacterium]
MDDLHDILALADELSDGESAAMATVVDLQGSAYRHPGARMLMTAGGRSAGMISGGCLEGRIHKSTP